MSLPEPINWLHMSGAEDYIYLVSTFAPKLGQGGPYRQEIFWHSLS